MVDTEPFTSRRRILLVAHRRSNHFALQQRNNVLAFYLLTLVSVAIQCESFNVVGYRQRCDKEQHTD